MPLPARSDWETPQEMFDELDREFHFTLDVCATPENAKCEQYFTPAIDGLAQDWGSEICWMNPPYGREVRAWMKAAYESSLDGATVVCLVPARTDTEWWHEYAEEAAERRFIKGRVPFVRTDGGRNRAPFPSVIVVFRPATAVQRCCA
jgi:site-specific DNA-methyltransferase (adenine-specific)